MASRSGHAGRDHAAAGLVSLPHRQGVVLVANGSRAVARFDGAAAPSPQPARRYDRRAVCEPPESVRDWITGSTSSPLSVAFGMLDRLLRVAEPFFPADPRRRAIERAVAFVTERLNGEDGLGGIFPAMANAVMMFDCLGYERDHPDYATALAAVRKLLVLDGERSYCQPCLSPVWDTALACHALMEVDDERLESTLQASARLARKQAGAGGGRRLGGDAPGSAPRRVGIPVREPVLPRSRRHGGGGSRSRPLRLGALSRCDRSSGRVGRRNAEPEWRVGHPSTPTTPTIT